MPARAGQYIFVRALVLFASQNAREVVFAVGLMLLGGGLSLVSIPAALIVTGGLLVWLAIPPSIPAVVTDRVKHGTPD